MTASPQSNPIVVQLPEGGPVPTSLPEEEQLAAWARAALQGAPQPVPEGELVLRITDREEIASLNEHFRGKAGPTNVLSFPADLPAGPWAPVLGDVIICKEVVAEEAAAQGKAERAHWAHMVVHGVLHLLGYDHQQAAEAEAMEGLERQILADLGLPDPYRED
jgi:probable rRNA maturation factor